MMAWPASIAMTFFATAGAFAGLSLWGYTTSKDISAWGSFLIMGVVGLIVASLLNAFLIGSPGLELAIAFLFRSHVIRHGLSGAGHLQPPELRKDLI